MRLVQLGQRLATQVGQLRPCRPVRRVELIRALAALQAGESPTAETAAAEAEALSFPGARVLVVDDSEVNREVAGEALSRLGAAADFACEVRRAELVPDPGDETRYRTLCPDGTFVEIAPASWALVLSGPQDWATAGLSRLLFDHEGEELTVTVDAYGHTHTPTDAERVVQLTSFAQLYVGLTAEGAAPVSDTPGSDGGSVLGPVSSDSAAPQG